MVVDGFPEEREALRFEKKLKPLQRRRNRREYNMAVMVANKYFPERHLHICMLD
jgi:hypothetical protein